MVLGHGWNSRFLPLLLSVAQFSVPQPSIYKEQAWSRETQPDQGEGEHLSGRDYPIAAFSMMKELVQVSPHCGRSSATDSLHSRSTRIKCRKKENTLPRPTPGLLTASLGALSRTFFFSQYLISPILFSTPASSYPFPGYMPTSKTWYPGYPGWWRAPPWGGSVAWGAAQPSHSALQIGTAELVSDFAYPSRSLS